MKGQHVNTARELRYAPIGTVIANDGGLFRKTAKDGWQAVNRRGHAYDLGGMGLGFEFASEAIVLPVSIELLLVHIDGDTLRNVMRAHVITSLTSSADEWIGYACLCGARITGGPTRFADHQTDAVIAASQPKEETP